MSYPYIHIAHFVLRRFFLLLCLGRLDTSFSVGYGTGSVSGNAVHDTVVVGDATATGQILGVANKTQGFALVAPFDGIRAFNRTFIF